MAAKKCKILYIYALQHWLRRGGSKFKPWTPLLFNRRVLYNHAFIKQPLVTVFPELPAILQCISAFPGLIYHDNLI
jgi:hypothetical protein